jgi:hypothetical protein
MANNSKKVISINPEYFKFGGKSSKKKKKKKKRDDNILSSSVNKGLKKSLLNKLKEHQRKKEIEKLKNEELDGGDRHKVNGELEKSIEYLNEIVKKRKKNKENRKSRTMKKRPVIDNTPTINVRTPEPTSNILPNPLDARPKFGCLKGGKLPTFKQYNKTLKNNETTQRPPLVFNDVPVYEESFDERQKNLNNITVKYNSVEEIRDIPAPTATILSNIPIITSSQNTSKNHSHNKKKRRKHKLKTIKRKITLGKKHGMVGVLIKNRKTRKNVKKEVSNLEKKSLNNIKKYLRKHNLIKIGTSAPDDILRNIYESSYLSGDIYNKNPETLLHNFMKA